MDRNYQVIQDSLAEWMKKEVYVNTFGGSLEWNFVFFNGQDFLYSYEHHKGGPQVFACFYDVFTLFEFLLAKVLKGFALESYDETARLKILHNTLFKKNKPHTLPQAFPYPDFPVYEI